MSGTLALAAVLPPDYYYQMSLAKVDGNSLRPMGYGSAPSLSLDWTRVVHMTAAVGLFTLRLVRVAIGNIKPGHLEVGQWRELTAPVVSL